MGKKRPRNSIEKNKADNAAKTATEELPAPVRQSEDEPEAKKSKWIKPSDHNTDYFLIQNKYREIFPSIQQ